MILGKRSVALIMVITDDKNKITEKKHVQLAWERVYGLCLNYIQGWAVPLLDGIREK